MTGVQTCALPIYHSTASVGSELSETLKIMERRLQRGIMNPAGIAVWLFGGLLATVQDLSQGWLWAKLVMVALMTWLQHLFTRWRKEFEQDRNTRPQRFYRMVNEAPTLLLIGIVIMVIVRPF